MHKRQLVSAQNARLAFQNVKSGLTSHPLLCKMRALNEARRFFGGIMWIKGLDEIDNKTMQSKIVPNLYFCGEVLDIDGFCGGFNLQNCWSTAYVVAQSILVR